MRVAGNPVTLAARLREEVRAASQAFRVSTITTQSAVVDRTLLRERLLALLSGFFALVGLVLLGLMPAPFADLAQAAVTPLLR